MSERRRWFVLGVIVTAAFVFLLGQSTANEPQIGRYQMIVGDDSEDALLWDTATGTAARVHFITGIRAGNVSSDLNYGGKRDTAVLSISEVEMLTGIMGQ